MSTGDPRSRSVGTQKLARAAATLGRDWPSTHSSEFRELFREITKKILLHHDKLEIYLSKSALLDALMGEEQRSSFLQKTAQTRQHGNDDLICLKLEARFTRVGSETTLVIPAEGHNQAFARPVHSLVKAVARGRA